MPEKPKTRVWQQTNPNKLQKLVTLNRPERLEAGTTMPAVFKAISPNIAAQYVLPETALMYEAQLEAMLRYQDTHGLIEIAAKDIGKKPEAEEEKSLDVQKLESQLAKHGSDMEEVAELKSSLKASQKQGKALEGLIEGMHEKLEKLAAENAALRSKASEKAVGPKNKED